MAQRWASRTEFGDEPNALSTAIAERRARGRPLLDLTVSNPTRCGFTYDAALLRGAFASPDALRYEADALGMLTARQAIAEAYYASRGIAVDPERMLLTSSTSEAYGYFLRLLCDAGDEILVPQPSYPLFDLLARLHDVRLVSYPLLRHDGWRIDLRALRVAVGPRTRALVLVHPNNPTGHAVDAAEREQVEKLAAEFGLALLVDEVFLDFPVETVQPLASFASGDAPVLTFVMSGLSKVAALPQMKLAWTVVRGPQGVVAGAMHRLEFIADTFLSPNAPVQHAVGEWLRGAPAMQQQVRERTRGNLRALDRLLLAHPLCSRLSVQAGWCVLLRLPATEADEDFALSLLERADVIVHPGSFYGLPDRGWIVVSLLVDAATFEQGIERCLQSVRP